MAIETRDVYMNRVQQRIFYAGARDLRVLAARRFGKTDGVLPDVSERPTVCLVLVSGLWRIVCRRGQADSSVRAGNSCFTVPSLA